MNFSRTLMLDLLITMVCALLAYGIHINSFINWDVAWHVEGAKRMLEGRNYFNGLFDTNAPFVFAYFFPVIALKKLSNFSYPYLINVYILFSTMIPLTLSYILINKAFKPNEALTKRFIYYTVVFIIFFLPAFNFGHREIVLIYFYLPYFFAALFSTTYPTTFKISHGFFYATAVLASFGVLQNIIYLCIPIFIDIYRWIKTKKFERYQKLFYLGVIINVIIIFLLYPEYITHIVPMVLCYEGGFNFPILTLFIETLTVISLLTIFLVLVNFKKFYKSDDIFICFIATTLSLLIYFFEMKLWYYHLYPALSFALLIMSLMITKYYEQTFFGMTIQPRVNLMSASLASAMIIMVILVIFTFTRNDINIFYNRSEADHRWLRYSKAHFKNKKLFFFVIKLGPAYALPLYADANINVVSPWSNPWMLPYIILQKSPQTELCNKNKDIALFQQLAANAIATYKPDFIITEKTPKSLLYQGKNFNYIDFFSNNALFKMGFKHYIHYDDFETFVIYKLAK